MNVHEERGATHTAIRVGGDQNIGFVEGNHPLHRGMPVQHARRLLVNEQVHLEPLKLEQRVDQRRRQKRLADAVVDADEQHLPSRRQLRRRALLTPEPEQQKRREAGEDRLPELFERFQQQPGTLEQSQTRPKPL